MNKGPQDPQNNRLIFISKLKDVEKRVEKELNANKK